MPDQRAVPPRCAAGRIDAAVIATPTVYHHEVAAELLGDGVHLLIEKPVTSTVAEANHLIATGRRQQPGAAGRTCRTIQSGLERRGPPLDATAVHRSGARRYLHLPLHRRQYRARSDDSRSRSGAVAGAQPRRRRRGDGNGTVRPPRRPGLGPSDVRQRLCRQPEGVTRELRTATDHAGLRQRAFAAIDFATGEAKLVRPSESVMRRQVDLVSTPPDARQAIQETMFQDLLCMEDGGRRIAPMPSCRNNANSSPPFCTGNRSACRVSKDAMLWRWPSRFWQSIRAASLEQRRPRRHRSPRNLPRSDRACQTSRLMRLSPNPAKGVEPHVVQVAIEWARLEQLRVGPFRMQLPFVQDNDLVHRAQGREPRRKEDQRPSRTSQPQRLVQAGSRRLVDFVRGFGNHQDRRIAQQRAGQADAKCFARCSAPRRCRQAGWKSHVEVPSRNSAPAPASRHR